MMSEYTPDSWFIVKITPKDTEPFYKVVAGWSGGYLYGDSWRVNSGIKSYKEEEDCYYFYGNSGSVYRCRKGLEEQRMSTQGILHQLKSLKDVQVDEVLFKDIKEDIPHG